MHNPLSFNYPKTGFIRRSKFLQYPRMNMINPSLGQKDKKDVNIELTKVLEKEISELHSLTEKAKRDAEMKKLKEKALKRRTLNNDYKYKQNIVSVIKKRFNNKNHFFKCVKIVNY